MSFVFRNLNTQASDASTDRLLKEYQKSRAEIIRQFDEHETRRNEIQKQLSKISLFIHFFPNLSFSH